MYAECLMWCLFPGLGCDDINGKFVKLETCEASTTCNSSYISLCTIFEAVVLWGLGYKVTGQYLKHVKNPG